MNEAHPITDDEYNQACNAVIHYLDCDELERWSNAEQIEKAAKKDMEILCAKVRDRGRILTDNQKETVKDHPLKDHPEFADYLARMARIWPEFPNMYPEESERFAALCKKCGDAGMIMASLMEIVGQRIEGELGEEDENKN